MKKVSIVLALMAGIAICEEKAAVPAPPAPPAEKPLDQTSITLFDNLRLKLENLDLQRRETDRQRIDLITAVCKTVDATPTDECVINLDVNQSHPMPTVAKRLPAPPAPAAKPAPVPEKK